jgi:hypothetical protein
MPISQLNPNSHTSLDAMLGGKVPHVPLAQVHAICRGQERKVTGYLI